MRNRIALRRIGLALGGTVAAAALTLTTTAANATTTAPVGRFAAQAQAAHLTTTQIQGLQQKVDQEVSRTHGTQVSLNRVLWGNKGGSTTFPLPGQRIATDAGQPVEPASTLHGCRYGYFCIYTGGHYTGTRKDFYHCQWYSVTFNEYWSYMNNQTPGTRATFQYEDFYGTVHDIDTPPAAHSNPVSGYLYDADRLKAC